MSVIQLLFREGNFINDIELDVTISETTNTSSRYTKNPVQEGADINDHIVIEPLEFEISGAVSNTSSSAVGQIGGAFDKLTSAETKSEETWSKLLKLQAEKTLFIFNTTLNSYPNIQITSLRQITDKDNANALFFTAQLSEFIVPPSVLSGNFLDQNVADSASSAVNGGLKQP